MSRPSPDYLLFINLRRGTDARRFCQVVVNGDDVYIIEPKKKGPEKLSYHESGERHLMIGNGEREFRMFLDPPSRIVTQETPWIQVFDKFNSLLDYGRYQGPPPNEIVTMDVSDVLPSGTHHFAEVSIGRRFDGNEWTLDGVQKREIRRWTFLLEKSPSRLQLCVRWGEFVVSVTDSTLLD